MVDNSHPIPENACIDQQQGISNYFEAFYDLNAGNVLSYVSFDGNSMTKIIDFDDEKQTPFVELVNKVQRLPCNNDHFMAVDQTSVGIDIFQALKFTVSLFRNNNLTPRILLFNNFEDNNNIETTVCEYFQDYNNLSLNGIPWVEVTVVNILGNGISNHYLKCLAQINYDGKQRYFEFKDSSPEEFAVHQQNVVDSVCAIPLGIKGSGAKSEAEQRYISISNGSNRYIIEISGKLYLLIVILLILLTMNIAIMCWNCCRSKHACGYDMIKVDDSQIEV